MLEGIGTEVDEELGQSVDPDHLVGRRHQYREDVPGEHPLVNRAYDHLTVRFLAVEVGLHQ
jgi:hypothetical protein